ncbi:MAG: AAA family ATPase [Candidatus Micrarchaeota archaeon]|nr:AAA family ATPase [Candidatus Micrarchaeota archaeon]
MVQQENDENVSIRSNISKDVIRKYHRAPMALYRIKDVYADVTTNPNFVDSLLVIAALIAFGGAFPFYPIIMLALIAFALFIVTLRHAFLGLIVLMAVIFPMLMYQTPSLAYIFIMIMSIGLVFGYRHYRTFIFAAILLPLALSPLGYIFAIPTLIIGVLIVGYRRSAFLGVLFVLGVVMLSGVTGVQNTGYISYNAQIAHNKLATTPALNYSVPNKQGASMLTFPGDVGVVTANIGNQNIVSYMYSEFAALFMALEVQPLQYMIDLIGIVIIVMFIDTTAVASRSAYKGAEASLIGIGYPLIYFAVSLSFRNSFTYLLPLGSFIIAPAFIYILELYKIDVVKALDVRKEDLRLKFGEAFEDLIYSNTSDKFSDIGDYEATKRELRSAIISPIEQKAVSRAYNIKPIKGVLLFGPPGTGKTLLMRAIANDIRAGFFLVKAPSLISSSPGDTERRLANIFATAKKNAPCVLFFDEIDSVARNRSQVNVDEVHRQILSELLIEMDGFQQLRNVIVVGATNVPNLIDPALLRPGRFDKAIYMPLPDFNGRKEIFRIYLSRLPVSKDVKIDDLAKMTERFTGADIKTLCDNVAQEIAQEAASQHRVLEITQEDLKSFILATKPSTSLSQLKDYEKFKIDFERRTLKQEKIEKYKETAIEDIVGLDDAKNSVVDAIKVPMEHPELVKKYNVKAIKGILMFGPPGGGKTMFMRAISNELKGVTMLDINGAEIGQQSSAKATAAIKDIFNRAVENAPSILFIDELDGIAPKRKHATEKGVQLTDEFLQEMDGLKETQGVVLVCATNRPSSLDPAILRPGRFDKLVFVGPPDEKHRAVMFENYTKNVPLGGDVDFNELAKETEGYTGADIANICREAKQKALNESVSTGKEVEIAMASLQEIIKKFKPSAPDALVNSYKAFLDKYGQR